MMVLAWVLAGSLPTAKFHVINGDLDVVPFFAGGMGCISRVLPTPLPVEEDDLPSNALSSSQRACLRSCTNSSDRISSRTLSLLASFIWSA